MILSRPMLEILVIITNYALLDQGFGGNEWVIGSRGLGGPAFVSESFPLA